jgi:hypothetical protein
MPGNNLTGSSVTYSTTTYKFGTASFSGGTGTAVSSTNLITAPPYTIEGWINSTSTGEVFAFGEYQVVFVGLYSNDALAILGNVAGFPGGSTAINNGAWHHLAFSVSSGGAYNFFVDGSSVATGTMPAVTYGAFAVGYDNALGGYNFSGYIDEVAVWSTQKYTSNFTPPTSAYLGTETGLIALYHFDSNLNDSSTVASTIGTGGRGLTMVSATYDGLGQKFGQAALSGGYGSMPTLMPTAIGSYPFTVECFAKATIVPTSVGYVAAQSACFGIGVTASATYQFIVGGTTTVTSSPVASGSWNHLALVATATLATMYVNGQIAGTLASPGSLTTTALTYIHSQSTTTNPFLGDVQDVAFWNTAKYTTTFAPPTTQYTGSEGMLSLYHLGGSGTDYAFTANSGWVPATSSSIVYSPYNWWVTNIGAYTTCAGAYFKIMFTGNTAILTFDTSNLLSPYSEIYYRIDGYSAQTPWTLATLSTVPQATVTCTVGTLTTTGSPLITPLYHLLEVRVKSTSINLNRFIHPSNTAIILQGIQLTTGALTVAPATYPKHILFYGDTLTEGYYSVNSTAANDTDSHDASTCYSTLTCEKLNAEYGIVAYGNTGWSVASTTSAGAVPALTSFYGYLTPTTARTFTPTPDLIIINMGTVDWSQSSPVATTKTAINTVLTGLLAATPASTKIIVMVPFAADGLNFTGTAISTINGYTVSAYCGSTIPGAITSTTRVTYLSTSGFLNANYGMNDSIHPTGVNHISQITPQLVNAIIPIFLPANNKYTHS